MKKWNKTNRYSNKANEWYKKIVGRASCTPCITRWNSFHDSVTELLKIKELLTKISEALKIPYFIVQDIKFLEEYKICTDPILFKCFARRERNIYIFWQYFTLEL